MKIQGVQQQWQEFLKAVDPRGRFPDRQRREMRKAFLSGFYAMLVTCIQISEIESDDEGVQTLENIRQECERLIRDMISADSNLN